MSDFKQITLKDPVAQLPDLTFALDAGGYSRASVGRRKTNGRTNAGSTKIVGASSDPYFIWAINVNLVPQEKAFLFEDYLEALSDRLSPSSSLPAYLTLIDEFEKTPAKVNPRWSLLEGSETYRSYKINNQNLVAGFGIFKVIIAIDNNYSELISSCRYKLSFSIEEVN